MGLNTRKDQRIFEGMLLVVVLGMTYLVYQMGPFKMVVLHLFFLPVLLSGFFLGRGSAGVLALFCAVAVGVATVLSPSGLAAYNTPVMIALAITVWGSVLGLAAVLMGTLCDDRADKIEELHEAYVGVVSVLATYLQSANPKGKARSTRVAELSQAVAEEMRLTRKQIDDICVAALMHDIANVEITTKLISKAVDTLETNQLRPEKHTFLGADLVHSLGTVLHGAVPLILNQDDSLRDAVATELGDRVAEMPVGAKIIRAAREYDHLAYDDSGAEAQSPEAALKQLQENRGQGLDEEILSVLKRTVLKGKRKENLQPAIA